MTTLQKIIVETTVLDHLLLKYGLKQPISRQNNFDGLI